MADPIPPIQQMPWWKVVIKIAVAVYISKGWAGPGAYILDAKGIGAGCFIGGGRAAAAVTEEEGVANSVADK